MAKIGDLKDVPCFSKIFLLLVGQNKIDYIMDKVNLKYICFPTAFPLSLFSNPVMHFVHTMTQIKLLNIVDGLHDQLVKARPPACNMTWTITSLHLLRWKYMYYSATQIACTIAYILYIYIRGQGPVRCSRSKHGVYSKDLGNL